MLGSEDRKKLEFLESVLKRGSSVSNEEAAWLIKNLKATISRPDEYDFPEFVALYDATKHDAFALLRSQRPGWQQDTILDERQVRDGADVFDLTTKCEKYEAHMAVRPWVRVHQAAAETAADVLRKCVISVICDGAPLLKEAPLEDYLIGQDGEGFRHQTYFFRPPDKYVLDAWALTPGKLEADPSRPLGVFLAGGVRVRVKIQSPVHVGGWVIPVVAGVTGMLYTTKVPGGGHELSIPREIKGTGK